MTPRTLTASAGLLVLAALAALIAQAAAAKRPASQSSLPAHAPGAVSPAFDILLAKPFVLDTPYEHTWRAKKPSVQAGYLLVVDVDPTYVVPRNQLEPVLYVGAQTAERLNTGFPSGRVVVLVPAPVAANGAPDLDLESTLIWFGSPELPERIDQDRIAFELQRAIEAGVTPLPKARIQAALAANAPGFTGTLPRFANRTALERFAAQQILTWVPTESEIADGILVPLVR